MQNVTIVFNSRFTATPTPSPVSTHSDLRHYRYPSAQTCHNVMSRKHDKRLAHSTYRDIISGAWPVIRFKSLTFNYFYQSSMASGNQLVKTEQLLTVSGSFFTRAPGAETCNQYLQRGSKVYVEGRLSSRTYVGNDGETRVSLDVNASEVRFIDSRGANASSEGGSIPDSTGSSSTSPSIEGEGEIEDDLPW